MVASLLGVYKSQTAGGKRYDLAAIGRARANATFLESHAVDTMTSAVYAMDLSPLVCNEKLDVTGYVSELMDQFSGAVRKQIAGG